MLILIGGGMSQIAALLETLKREMKAAGVTYAMAGTQLGLSESSIKRLFSDQHLSLERLEQLCALVGLDITTLVRKMAEERKRIAMLSREQEREVAAHPKLLLVAICVLNRLSFDEIVATYTIGEHECIQLLARLDRLKIIDLLPNNRFRLVVDEDFRKVGLVVDPTVEVGGPLDSPYHGTAQGSAGLVAARHQGVGRDVLRAVPRLSARRVLASSS